MFKFRNLLVVGIGVMMLVFLMAPWASAQPFLQDTATPEATTFPSDTPAPSSVATDTPMPTTAATDTPEPTVAATATEAAVAPAVTPLSTPSATPISTPSTLPTTGGSDDGTAAMSLLLIGAGVVILAGLAGLAMSRRSR